MIIVGSHYALTPFEIRTISALYPNFMLFHDLEHIDKLQEISLASVRDEDNLIIKNLSGEQIDVADSLDALKQEGFRIITLEQFMENHLHKCFVQHGEYTSTKLDTIEPLPISSYVLKRVVDYLASFALLLLVWPIMLWAALKIKKQSPGPIFFTQSRVGLNGKDFTCMKFRSMHVNSHFDPYTQKNDTRIFEFGNFMRKTRIDELPQVFNVLKGDMHFVGPRAEWNILVDDYRTKLSYYDKRHFIRPGITGWAQVNYPYGQNLEDTRQKLMYDLYFIKNWTLVLEIKTMLMTVGTVLGKKGL